MDSLPVVCQTISTKFVPPPTPKECLHSILAALKKFTNQLRWIEFFATNKILENVETNQGLGTDFKGPTATAPKGRDFIETFIKVLVRAILTNFKVEWETETFTSASFSSTNSLVSNFIHNIRNLGDYVMVATDKTNSWRKIPTRDYENYAMKAIEEVAQLTPRSVLVETHSKALIFVKTLIESNKISKKEAE